KPPLLTPSIHYTDETINIMLDWNVVVLAKCAEDALALWISMFDIFGQHRVPTRLLFSMIYNDKSETTKATRKTLNNWQIQLDSIVPKITIKSSEQENVPAAAAIAIADKLKENDSASLTSATENSNNDQQPPAPPIQVPNQKRKFEEMIDHETENNPPEDPHPKEQSTKPVPGKRHTSTSNQTVIHKTTVPKTTTRRRRRY
ncbi:unnamed protein product, partial [Didymodactylos carnosus]